MVESQARAVVLSVIVLVATVGGVVGPAVQGVAAQDADQVRGEPDIEVYAPENRLVPGVETTLAVYLNNRGEIDEGGPDNLESRVQTARSTVVSIDDEGLPLNVSTGSTPIGDVPEGTSGPVEFDVVAREGAEPGTYEVPVELDYEYTRRSEVDDGTTYHDDRERTVTHTLEVEIAEQATFAVVDTDATVQIGQDGNMSVTVKNVGDEPARNATMTVGAPDSDVSFPAGASTSDSFAGTWSPNETRTMEFGVSVAEGAEVRPYTVEIDVEFRDPAGFERASRQLPAGFRPTDAQSFSVEGLDSTLQVDSEGRVEVEVTNRGPEPVRDAILIFEGDAPAAAGADGPQGDALADPNVDPLDPQAAIGDLAPGESETVRFRAAIGADASPGLRALSMAVRYRNEFDEVVTGDVRDAFVEVAPEQTFDVSVDESTLQVADDGRVRLEVTNEGPTWAENAIVLLDGQAPAADQGDLQSEDLADPNVAPADGQVAVGDLSPGASRNVTFEADVTEDASPGERALSVAIRYRNEFGEVETTDPLDAFVEVAPEQDLRVTATDSTLQVGEDGRFDADLVNEGPEPIENAVVIFGASAPAVQGEGPVAQQVSAEDLEDPNVVVRDPQDTVGDLDAGERATVSFRAGIRNDADPGNRTLTVAVRYRDEEGDVVTTDTLDVVAEVAPESDPFRVEPVNATVAPGYEGPLAVAVTNTAGEPVSDVEAKLFTDDPLDSGDDEAYAGSLAPNETVVLTFDLSVGSGALEKEYAASIDFRYEDDRGDERLSEAQQVPVTVRASEEESGLSVPIRAAAVAGVLLVVAGVVAVRRSESVRDRVRAIDPRTR